MMRPRQASANVEHSMSIDTTVVLCVQHRTFVLELDWRWANRTAAPTPYLAATGAPADAIDVTAAIGKQGIAGKGSGRLLKQESGNATDIPFGVPIRPIGFCFNSCSALSGEYF